MNNLYRIHPQPAFNFGGLVIDNFAGGGGASTGIELGLGRPVDIAINQPRPLAVRALEVHSLCDVCGAYRNRGSHTKCSKIRQARNAHKWTK